jgi:hypothetical protein
MGRAMVKEDFEAVADALYQLASKAIAQNMHIAPLMFILRVDEKHKVDKLFPVECAFLFQQRFGIPGKQMAAEVLRRLSATPETDIAALVTEAWVVEATTEDMQANPIDGDNLQDDPRRKEAVIAFLRTPDFSAMASWMLDREHHMLKYEPVKWGGDGLTGRFAHRAPGEAIN